MDNYQQVSNKTLQETLFELQEPVVFKNILCTTEGSNCWKLIDWSLEDIADKLDDMKLPFRVGKNTKTTHPQWEVETPIEYKTLKDFLNDVKQNNDLTKWFYFDYKYVKEWFKEKPEILKSFNWHQFELQLDGSDSTIWIGSKGAHSNCHQDTYGCNLVAQTHGRKLWLLFSPECSNYMEFTRIPYEESTIYSKYNFFSPGKQEIQVIKNMVGNVKMITLEPKDVLFIPKGWWHYVESLETTLSVNVWLPIKEYCDARLKEALVNLVISTIGNGILKAVDQPESSLPECIELVEQSIKECQKLEEGREPLQKRKKLNYDNSAILQIFKTKYPNDIQFLPNLTNDNLPDFINKNKTCIDDNINLQENINDT